MFVQAKNNPFLGEGVLIISRILNGQFKGIFLNQSADIKAALLKLGYC